MTFPMAGDSTMFHVEQEPYLFHVEQGSRGLWSEKVPLTEKDFLRLASQRHAPEMLGAVSRVPEESRPESSVSISNAVAGSSRPAVAPKLDCIVGNVMDTVLRNGTRAEARDYISCSWPVIVELSEIRGLWYPYQGLRGNVTVVVLTE